MGRGRIPAPPRRVDDPRSTEGRSSAQAPARSTTRPGRGRRVGLFIKERDGHWHIGGTTAVRGRTFNPRRSTGLRATPENLPLAEDIKKRLEAEFFDLVVYGKKPSKKLAAAAREYLGLDDQCERIAGQGRDLAWNDLKILKRAIAKFGIEPLDAISAADWSAWVKAENSGNQPQTLRRFWAPVRAFLAWCAESTQGWLNAVPAIDLPATKRRQHALRRRVAELYPELVTFLFDHAPIHLRAQVYVEWSTGARVKSILFGCRLCDLVLAPGRSQITFLDTKNGDGVIAHLHEAAAEVLADYLDWRGRLGDREGPLFLTDRKKPYSAHGREKGWGSENKTAWRGMRARAAATRQAMAADAGDDDERERLEAEAELLARVSPHWLRHWFATHALAAGMDLRAIMAQGGWRDYRSIQAYQHDVPEVRRRAIDSLPIGAGAVRTSAPVCTKIARGPRGRS